jgi:hypothetical protein
MELPGNRRIGFNASLKETIEAEGTSDSPERFEANCKNKKSGYSYNHWCVITQSPSSNDANHQSCDFALKTMKSGFQTTETPKCSVLTLSRREASAS